MKQKKKKKRRITKQRAFETESLPLGFHVKKGNHQER